jgi:tRNA pseudouridine55 synthase
MSLSGFLNLLKPPGITSHDAVAVVRRVAKEKAGHAGTLDPAASGVLVICVGKAVRLASFVADAEKEYQAGITFGVATDSLDAQGRVTGTADATGLTREALCEVLPEFVGEIKQRPPSFSAVKVRGRRAYEMARRGEQVELKERAVSVSELRLVSMEVGNPAVAVVDVRCGKGFYVRSLARDLGERLGLPAHLSSLVRTRVGDFRVEESVSLPEAERAAREGRLAEIMLPLDAPLSHLPRVVLEGREAELVCHGASVAWGGRVTESPVRVYDEQGRLVALAKTGEDGRLSPSIVLADES